MHSNFTDVLFYIMVTNMFQPFMGDFFNNKNKTSIMYLNHPTVLKRYIISGYNSLLNNKIKYGWWLQEYQKLRLLGVCRVMYFWLNWDILLKQMVVVIFNTFSFVFLWAYVDFAHWALIILIYSTFCALIRYIKRIKEQQMHFNIIAVFLSYYGHQHVSVVYVLIFIVIWEQEYTNN
jgi:hypothetical protein